MPQFLPDLVVSDLRRVHTIVNLEQYNASAIEAALAYVRGPESKAFSDVMVAWPRGQEFLQEARKVRDTKVVGNRTQIQSRGSFPLVFFLPFGGVGQGKYGL